MNNFRLYFYKPSTRFRLHMSSSTIWNKSFPLYKPSDELFISRQYGSR